MRESPRKMQDPQIDLLVSMHEAHSELLNALSYKMMWKRKIGLRRRLLEIFEHTVCNLKMSACWRRHELTKLLDIITYIRYGGTYIYEKTTKLMINSGIRGW